MSDELLDLVDKNDQIIGTVLKSVAHKNPDLIHREVAIAVFNNQGKVLLQQRSLNKTNPGEWKITAAGHVGSGEDPEAAVRREVYEELGIKIEPIFYKKVFKKRVDNAKSGEARFFYIYYAKMDEDRMLKLDPTEVMDTKWLNISDLENFSKTESYDISGLSHKTILETAKILKII